MTKCPDYAKDIHPNEEERICLAKDSGNWLRCTRPKGHCGDHHAHGVIPQNTCLRVWKGKKTYRSKGVLWQRLEDRWHQDAREGLSYCPE